MAISINEYVNKKYKNKKTMKIELMGPPCGELNLLGHNYPRIYQTEYKNIYLDHKITEEELALALNTLITYFMQKGSYAMVIDLDKRNKELKSAKEMTIEEIENKLGYKIKIINKEE